MEDCILNNNSSKHNDAQEPSMPTILSTQKFIAFKRIFSARKEVEDITQNIVWKKHTYTKLKDKTWKWWDPIKKKIIIIIKSPNRCSKSNISYDYFIIAHTKDCI